MGKENKKPKAFLTTSTASKIMRRQHQATIKFEFSPFILFAGPKEDINATPQRRKKKNKYAQFSRTSSSPTLSSPSSKSKKEIEELRSQKQLDPFDLLMLESK